jgi:N utilization substance protein B
MASRRKGRILAFQALYCWDSRSPQKAAGAAHEKFVEELLGFSWLEPEKRENMEEEITAFSRLLIAGTIENIAAIDGMIQSHLQNWDISRLNRVDLAVLRISVYALMFQQDLAPSIVINEAIGISREFGADDSFRFINGVLDSIRKTLERAPDREACPRG